MQLGLFTDIHFQPSGLDRIVKTGDWIIEEFTRQGVQAVVCMGDALVTREEVDVVAQSAAIQFFRKLAQHWPVFLTLGNHDLNLKHSTSVSSLDGLDMHPKIKVFREITEVGGLFLFVPYHEDQSKIVSWVQDFARQNPEKARNMTVFGHLSLNGAVQNTKYGTHFAGAIGPDLFEPFKATYSGHFHVHNKMANRVTYVGSPLQFNFGDAGDQRGIMVLDTDTGADRFITNPHHDAFKVISAKELMEQPEYAWESLKDCFVTVIYDDIVTEDQHEVIQKRLEGCGVISVKKESVVEKAIRENVIEVDGVRAASAVDLVEPFVASVLSADSQLDKATAIAFGKAIITEVNATFQNVADTGAIFEGDITDIFITKFLGVNDTIHIKVSDLAKGIWYFEGENGAGKSTILEAIFWCYFGETIRSDMKADDVVFDPHETGKGKDTEVVVVHANGWSMNRFRKNAKMGGTGVKVFKDGHYREDFEKGNPQATQKAINDLLGINAENFIRSNIMGQNVTANFISGDEKKRRAMIEEMLGLERFDAYLEKTREYKKSIGDQLDQQESIQKIRAGEIERSAGQVGQIEAQIVQAEKDHQDKLDSLAQRQANLNEAVKNDMVTLAAEAETAEKAARAAQKIWDDAVAEHQIVGAAQATIENDAKVESDKADACAATITRVDASCSAFTLALVNIETERKGYADNIELAKAKITQAEAGLALEPKVIEAHRKADAFRMNASIADQVTAELRATAAAIVAQSDPLTNKAAKLLQLNEGECPSCSQPVDKAGIKKITDGLLAEVDVLREKWREASAAAKKSEEFAKQLRADADAVLVGCPTLAQMDAIRTMISTLKGNITLNETSLAAMPAKVTQAQKMLHDRLVLDVPGYHWGASPDAEEIQGVLAKLRNDASLARVKAQSILAQSDGVKLKQAQAGLDLAENASNVADEALRRVRERKSATEAANKATAEALVREHRNLLCNDPSQALRLTRDRLVADRAAALAEMEDAKLAAVALSQKAAYVVFWDRAFAAKGSMRAFLLDQSVKQLNTVVAGFIDQHFGGRMTLTFNSDLTFQQRYGRRSGGQRRWTDLAAMFALFELCRQRSRYRSSYLGLDEVFDALDLKGRQAVLELINGMVARVARIFVITHVDVPGSSKVGTIQARMPDLDTGTQLTVKPV
jgi:DNA repair exonuclease SbcCD ATPase subunit/DNA repair exonuclease SbcCD nuclease subunit